MRRGIFVVFELSSQRSRVQFPSTPPSLLFKFNSLSFGTLHNHRHQTVIKVVFLWGLQARISLVCFGSVELQAGCLVTPLEAAMGCHRM